MDAIKKIAFTFGDKILLGALLMWALYEIAISLSEMGGTPSLIKQANEVIEKVDRSSPPAPEEKKYDFLERFDDERSWVLDDFETQRDSLFYISRKVNKSVKQKAYEKMLNEHECVFYTREDGSKVCMFPGCPKTVAPPDNMIGLPDAFKLVEATIMTIELSWNQPTELIQSKLTHFILQRKKEGSDEWESIKGEDGEPLKIGTEFAQKQPMFGDVAPELSDIPPGAFGAPGAVPPGEFFPEEFFPGEFGFGAEFGFPTPEEMQRNAAPSGASSQKKETIQRKERSTTSSRTDAKDESIVREETDFTYLDYNLDPNTTYMYRIKSYGISYNEKREIIEIESDGWSEPVTAKTKEDKNVRFTKYIPGLRNKKGELVKKADGSLVSRDKVYVTVSKLFDPPWSPQRYFVEYEHKGIVPGLEGSDGIGKEVSNFNLFTSNGDPVYIDKRGEKFLYVHPEVSEDKVKAELEANPKDWKRYRIKQDFTLPWKAITIREEVKEDKSIKEVFDGTGKKVEKVEVKKTYHYYLDMVNRVTKEKESVELERDNPEVRILKF